MSTEIDVEVDENADPSDYPLWYKQYLKLDESQRKEIHKIALKRLKEAKPDAFKFVQKFGCKLVGITPRTEYSLVSEKDGEVNVTYVHKYAMPTLLFWCPQGEFHFSINANLKYNDTVLNEVKGNKVDREIRGLTS